MILLAQETFESYQQIATHEVLRGSLVNPFNPDGLLQPGSFFYPYVGQTWEWTFLCLLLGGVVLWIYHRVNDAPLFQNLGYSLIALAVVILTFFRTAFPHPFGFVLGGLCLLAVLANVTAILGVAAVQKLPYFGLDEKFLTNPDDGEIRPYVMYAVAALVVAVPYWMVKILDRFLFALSGNNDLLVYVVLAGAVVVAGMVGNDMLPWRILRDHPILGGGFMKELAKIFSMPGPATRGEVVLVGIFTCLAYASTIFVFKTGGVAGTDMIGMILVATVTLNIVRAELARSAKAGVAERKPLRKTPWS